MPIIAVECVHCGAKLKVKAGASRTPPFIKCPKCSKQIPFSQKSSPSAPPPTDAPEPTVDQTAVPAAEDVQVPEAPTSPEEESVMPPPLPPADVPALSPDNGEQVIDPDVEPEPPRAETPIPPPPPRPPDPPSSVRKAAAPIVISSLDDHPSAVWINIQCPSCRWQSRVREEVAGKKVQCKQCGNVISVEKPIAVPPPRPPTIRVAAPPPPAPAAIPIPVATPNPSTIRLASARDIEPSPVPVPATVDSLTARSQIAELQGKLAAAENRAMEAERRAAEAESALHEANSSKALEGVKTSRRIAELEAHLAEFQNVLIRMVSEDQAELKQIEQRMTALHHRLSRFDRT